MAGTLAALAMATAQPAFGTAGHSATGVPAAIRPSYAVLADLADSAPLVLRVEVRKLARVEPERAPGVQPGMGRFYVEAKVKELITGNAALGEDQRYLIDLPIDAKGKPPALSKKQVLLFARSVPDQPGVLQPVGRDAQLPWDPETEATLRGIIEELLNPGAPGRISGVTQAIYVQGALAGEGDTQIFLARPDGSAASISVHHKPGQSPTWGVSFSELTDNGVPPARETLAWYRLACFLPESLPAGTNLSETPTDSAQAALDYRFVIASLGPCPRTRG